MIASATVMLTFRVGSPTLFLSSSWPARLYTWFSSSCRCSGRWGFCRRSTPCCSGEWSRFWCLAWEAHPCPATSGKSWSICLHDDLQPFVTYRRRVLLFITSSLSLVKPISLLFNCTANRGEQTEM